MSDERAYTTGSWTGVAIVHRKRPLLAWLWDWAVFVFARSIHEAMGWACWATGHFLWLDRRDNPEHRWACWLLGGPAGIGLRGKLWWWGALRERPSRYEFVEPDVWSAGTGATFVLPARRTPLDGAEK